METELPALRWLLFVFALVAVYLFSSAKYSVMRLRELSKDNGSREENRRRGLLYRLTMSLLLDFRESLRVSNAMLAGAHFMLGLSLWLLVGGDVVIWGGRLTHLSYALLLLGVFLCSALLAYIVHSFAMRVLICEKPSPTIVAAVYALYLFKTLLAGPFKFLSFFSGLFAKPAAIEELRRVEAQTNAEISYVMTQGEMMPELDEEEQEMIEGVFTFSETVAREVMTPRIDVVTLPVTATFDEIVTIVVESGYSRFPVAGANNDDILGIVLAKDMLPYLARREGDGFDIRTLIRGCPFVPASKPIDDLLRDFKIHKIHMAIVVDEHGGVDGVVTLEDIIEEIIGDIYDESDDAELQMQENEDGTLLVDGGVLVSDFNERYRFSIPQGEFDTVGGFVFTHLGRIPEKGEGVILNRDGIFIKNTDGEITPASSEWEVEQFQGEVQLVVEKINGHRIETVHVSYSDRPGSSESQVAVS
ncbi:MAG: hemolysin family protein [bacterium]|nr:hemolysin family protein [bacterium]